MMKENEEVREEAENKTETLEISAPEKKRDNNLDASVSLAIRKRHIPAIIGIVGALVTVIACFMPLYSLSFFGMTRNIMYIEGDGVLVCVCAVIAAVLIFIHKQRFSVVPVIGEALFLCNTVILAKDFLDFGGSYGAGLIVLILGILISLVGIVLAFAWKTDRSTKKGNVITIVVLAVLAVLLAVIMIVGQAYENEKNYNKAIELMNKGDYDDAINLFKELEDYEDSQEKLTESKYLKAKSYLAEERYSDAKEIFEVLGEYEESVNLAKVCDFGKIKDSYWDSSDLPDTIDEIREKCPDLKEAKEFVDEKIKDQLDYYDSYEDNEGALEFLNKIADKWDVKDEIKKYKNNIAKIKAEEEEARRAEEEAQKVLQQEYQEAYTENLADYSELAGRYDGENGGSAEVNIYSSPEDGETGKLIGNISVELNDESYSGELVEVADYIFIIGDEYGPAVEVEFFTDDSGMATFSIYDVGEYVGTFYQTEHWYS